MIENNIFGFTPATDPCADSNSWNFSNLDYVSPEGVPTEEFDIYTAVETQVDVKINRQRAVTENYLKFSVLGTGKNNILVDNILKVSSGVVAASNPRTVLDTDLIYFESITQQFIPRIHWIEFLEVTGIKSPVFSKEFSRTEATADFVQAVTTKATETSSSENLLIDGAGRVIGTWVDITTPQNKPKVSPISEQAGTVFTTAFYSETDFLISTDNLVSFKETPVSSTIGELQTATKIIQIDPDCEIISPECELNYPSCKFADNTCFFRPQSPFAQYTERVGVPIETRGVRFELKVWANAEPTLHYAKKNQVTDSLYRKIDNGDGSWTFRSYDTVGWFSFYEINSNILDTNITKIEVITIKDVVSFDSAFKNLSSMTEIIFSDLTATRNITDFESAWEDCRSLISFPLIDTSSGTSFGSAWYNCYLLTSFPLIDTSNGRDFEAAWYGCKSLTSFPHLDVSSGTDFEETWYNCRALTSFPSLDVSNGTNFESAWENCSSLTSFPQLDVSSGTNFESAWEDCSSLTSFPLINTSSGTNFSYAWANCTSLPSCPGTNGTITIPVGASTANMCLGV